MDQNTGNLNPKDLDTSVSGTRETFKGKKILLAEDNELNREIAVEVLKGKGFEIDTANDGAIAVQMVENSIPGTYALVIMDIQMPNMDGHEATRRIRKLSDPDLASIPIIAMTANAFNEDRKVAIEVGMDDYITKPIDIDETMKTINNLLYKK